MKFSLKELNEFVSLDDFFKKPEDLAKILTLKGLEVEEVHTQKLDFVYVGQILSQKKHPQADRLQICEVQVFKREPSFWIVCGAQNQKVKDKVVVCLKGAVLPQGIEIKDRKIRGEMSQGMLASREELGFPKKEEGLWILPSETKVGQRFDSLHSLNDTYFDIALAPNRPDLMSHLGVARELSGILNRPLKLSEEFWPHQHTLVGVPEKHLQKVKLKKPRPQFSNQKTKKNIHIEDSKLCPFYQYGVLYNVRVQPSPPELRKRLEFLGLNSVNNIVDVTNWILMQWGQPLHAFDLDKINGDLHVKFSKTSSKFKTLDKKEIDLCGDELMITDDQKLLALAGIIGGQDSAIQETTQNILIEAAVFAPSTIRRTARRFGLNTDACFRYSRGVFPQTTLLALQKACQIVQQVAGGEIAPYSFEKMNVKPRHFIHISQKDLSSRMGVQVSLSEFENWMDQMHLRVKKKYFGEFREVKVQPTYYRKDLSIKEDLIEEWARLKGYDSVQETIPQIHFKNEWKEIQDWLKFLDRVHVVTKEQGLHQAINYSLVDRQFQSQFLGSQWVPSVGIQNPISKELNSLRQSLLPLLFKNILLNVRRGQRLGRLFEQGVCFSKKEESFEEHTYLALAFWGQEESLWKVSKESEKKRSVVFDLKSAFESLLKRMGYLDWKWEKFENPHSFLHPQQSLRLCIEDHVLGFLGGLSPLLKEENKIKEDVALGEINLSSLYLKNKKSFSLLSLCDYPLVYRDISLLMNETMPVGDVLNVLRENKNEFLKNISVVDCYEEVQKDHKAVTFRLSLQSDKETLSEKQISKYMEKISWILCEKLGVKIR